MQESIKQQVESNQSLQRSLQIAKDRVQKLKDTLLGKKDRKRKLHSLDALAPKGGAKKRRIHATRLVSKISTEFFSVHSCFLFLIFNCPMFRSFMNEVMGTPTTEDTDYSYIVKSLMKPTDVIQMLKDPRHKILRARVTREVLKDFKANGM